jgi:glucose/mannose-6-phosphate isomerase
VIASSHSGNTEEVLQTFGEAQQCGSSCLAVTTGGELLRLALAGGTPLLRFDHSGQPRSAVGFSFGLLLSVFTHLKLIPNPENELFLTVKAMRSQQKFLKADVPAVRNIAKRYAGQMLGRWVTILGSGILAPVARRWKTQVNELAKAWAQYEVLPEADHNTLAGVLEPQNSLPGLLALFLQCPADHPRNRLRSELTRKVFMVEGITTDDIHALGENRLSYQWTCLHLGDYISYYLAMGYGIDPTPVEAIKSLKMEMKAAG